MDCRRPNVSRVLSGALSSLLATAWTLAFILVSPTAHAADGDDSVLATVNRKTITQFDLKHSAFVAGVELNEQSRPTALERCIDRQLVEDRLAKQKVAAPDTEIERQTGVLFDALRKAQPDVDPAETLKSLGIDETRLRRELAISAAWSQWIRQTTTAEQIREHFERHREELDGRQMRGRQIVLLFTIESSRDRDTQTTRLAERLREIRREILAGKTTFVAAAREHSQAPSREQGGEMGLFSYRGRFPAAVSAAAFQLKPGELSEPVASPFGVHLVECIEVVPGQLSLEDVRQEILSNIGRAKWKDVVAAERRTAKIDLRHP